MALSDVADFLTNRFNCKQMPNDNDIFHIIISPSGQYFWWTLAPTEDESWEALKRDYPNIALAKQRGASVCGWS
jgi:hypothetical protein